MKKNPEIANLLPNRVSYKDLRENISSRQELNRELNSLKRFSVRGAEKIVVNKDEDVKKDNSLNILRAVYHISDLTDGRQLHFFDAAAPIVDFSSVDMSRAFFASRYRYAEINIIEIAIQ